MTARRVWVTVAYVGPDDVRGSRYVAQLSRPRAQLTAGYDYMGHARQREGMARALVAKHYPELTAELVDCTCMADSKYRYTFTVS